MKNNVISHTFLIRKSAYFYLQRVKISVWQKLRTTAADRIQNENPEKITITGGITINTVLYSQIRSRSFIGFINRISKLKDQGKLKPMSIC